MADEYDGLPEETRAGMDREYWERLQPEERQALKNVLCREPGCTRPRWQEAGSLHCEEHSLKASTAAYRAREWEERHGHSS